jgi:Ni/Co efflux regulator RcnB
VQRLHRSIALLVAVTMLVAGFAFSETAGASSKRQAHAKQVRKHKKHKKQRKHRRHKRRKHTRRPVATPSTLTGGFVSHTGSPSTGSAPSTSGSSYTGGTSSSGGSSSTGGSTGQSLTDPTVTVPGDIGCAYIQLSDDDPSTPDPAVSANGIRNLTVRLHVDADPIVTPTTSQGTAVNCGASAKVNEVISVTAKGYVGLFATVEWDEVDSTGATVSHQARTLDQTGTTVAPVTRRLSICVS